MVDRISINNDNFILISSDDVVLFFSLEDIKSINLVNDILKNSIELVFSFSINKENIKKFFLIYDLLLKDKQCRSRIVIDLSNESDEIIKENKEILRELELNSKCLFMYRYNTYATATIQEILDSILFVENQVEIVKNYNFSPVEALIFIFDMVRDRVYIKEDEEEFLDVSRNLSKIISSSKIVCVGFANMFSAIANKLGIYTESLNWYNENKFMSGHVSNISYVNDFVYDIHSIMEIDATKGRKKSDGNNSFLRSYKSFGNSILDAIRDNKNNNLAYKVDVNNLFYQILQQYQKYIQYFDSDNNIMVDLNALNLLEKIKKYYLIVGYDMDECFEIYNLIENKENKTIIKEKIDKILDVLKSSFYNFNIDIFDFMVMIYKVRRVQHSMDKDKYSLSIEEIYNIMSNYFGQLDNKNIFYLSLIMNLNCYCDFFNDIDSDMLESGIENINLDIKRMDLISTLRKIKKK